MAKKAKVLQQLEIVSSVLPIPIAWLDKDSRILGINEAGLTAIGITRESCVGKTLYDLYPLEMADHIKRHDKRVIREGISLAQEESIIDATTGKIKYFSAIKAPLYDDNKAIMGLVTIGIDITAEKKAKNLVKKAKLLEYFGIVASIIPAPVYWLDVNGTVLGANEATLRAVGALSGKAFVGMTGHDLYPVEMADHIRKHDEEVMQTGKILFQEECIVDLTTREIKYFTAIKAPLRDDDGYVIGLVGTSIDITSQKKEAEILTKRIKLLEDLNKITSLVPTPIYWEDVNSIILGANECVAEAAGVSSINDYIGKSLYELYPKEMADHIKAHNEEVMRTGKILSQEETIRDVSSGKIKYFAAIKAPLLDDDGNTIGIIGASVDITKQKELELLKHEEQEKFVKIANQVAHDIRSPLASLLMIEVHPFD